MVEINPKLEEMEMKTKVQIQDIAIVMIIIALGALMLSGSKLGHKIKARLMPKVVGEEVIANQTRACDIANRMIRDEYVSRNESDWLLRTSAGQKALGEYYDLRRENRRGTPEENVLFEFLTPTKNRYCAQ